MDYVYTGVTFFLGIIFSFVIVWYYEWRKKKNEIKYAASIIYEDILSQIKAQKELIRVLKNPSDFNALWKLREKEIFNKNIFINLLPEIIKLKLIYFEITNFYSFGEPINNRKDMIITSYEKIRNIFNNPDSKEELMKRYGLDEDLDDFCRYVQFNIEYGDKILKKIKAEYSIK
ncbi:hypothetical protein [Methanospirillum lacunae]|nr:hypothetical protein [Methanospirillum lacunae]